MEVKENKFFWFMNIFGIFVLIYNIKNLIVGTSKPRSEEIILVIEMFAAIALIFVPQLIEHIFKINMPNAMMNAYWVFLLLATFIGTGLQIIVAIPFWDKILHLYSGALLTLVGYGVLSYFFIDNLQVLKPTFVAFFGVIFSLASGLLWELWEFTCDSVLGMNLQRFATVEGVPFIGREALMDTMMDVIFNTGGIIIATVILFLFYRKNKDIFSIFFVSGKKEVSHDIII